jgi:hypothetical protein
MKKIIAIMLLLAPSLAQALSCVGPQPFSSNVFFQGKVLEVKTTEGQGSGCHRHYKIQVEKNWHGAKEGDIIEVDQEVWMCGGEDARLKSKKYFALTPDKNGKFSVGMCGDLTFAPYQGNGEIVPKFAARLKELNDNSKP